MKPNPVTWYIWFYVSPLTAVSPTTCTDVPLSPSEFKGTVTVITIQRNRPGNWAANLTNCSSGWLVLIMAKLRLDKARAVNWLYRLTGVRKGKLEGRYEISFWSLESKPISQGGLQSNTLRSFMERQNLGKVHVPHNKRTFKQRQKGNEGRTSRVGYLSIWGRGNDRCKGRKQ